MIWIRRIRSCRKRESRTGGQTTAKKAVPGGNYTRKHRIWEQSNRKNRWYSAERTPPTIRKDSDETRSARSSRSLCSTFTKRHKTNVPSTKGFCYVKSDLTSSLDLDKNMEDYLSTDSGVNSNSQSFICESSLDHSKRTISDGQPFLDFISSSPGISENPIA